LKIPSVKEIRTFIFNLPLIVNVIAWSKKQSLPGFFKVPIFDVVAFIFHELKRQTLIMRANAAAFDYFLSIFPFILFIFTLIPYVLPHFDFLILPNLTEQQIVYVSGTDEVDFGGTIVQLIDETIQEVKILPIQARKDLVSYLGNLATKSRAAQLSLVLLLTIFFSSNGMMTLFRGFEKSHRSTFKKRPAFKRRLIAIALTFLMGLLVLLSALLVVLGRIPINSMLHFINLDRFSPALIYLLRWIAIIGLFYFGIAMIYRYGAATFRRFNWFSPGATLATILCLLTLLGFTFFVDKFETYDKLYGAVGTIIVVMLWIQINCFILLIGFELNASIAVNRDLKEVALQNDD
jgi:membrane protein